MSFGHSCRCWLDQRLGLRRGYFGALPHQCLQLCIPCGICCLSEAQLPAKQREQCGDGSCRGKTIVAYCAVAIADAAQAVNLKDVKAPPCHYIPVGKAPSDRVEAAEAPARRRGTPATASPPSTPSSASSSDGSCLDQARQSGRREGQDLDASSGMHAAQLLHSFGCSRRPAPDCRQHCLWNAAAGTGPSCCCIQHLRRCEKLLWMLLVPTLSATAAICPLACP